MEPRDLEQIDTFLGMVGRTSLLDYYGLEATCSDEAVDKAIKGRRGWAQGQQANPKFRNEALWLIKNNALLRRVLVEKREAYVKELATRSESKNLQVLTLFIKGTLAGGTLTADAEQAILRQARTMGLKDDATHRQIETLLKDTGARRAPSDEPETGAANFVDYYDLIGVALGASLDEIESAHRAKYRWARSLRDKERVTRLYADLDEAWRVLKEPLRRAQYDAVYRGQMEGRPAAAAAKDIQGFLPGHTEASSGKSSSAPEDSTPVSADKTPPRRKAPPRPPAVGRDRSLGFSGQPTEEATAPPVRPPKPPDGIRTLGLNTGKRRRAGPRLAVASPELLVLEVGRSPLEHGIIVRNTGRGAMRGRANSDRDWLKIERSRLDPDAAEQEVRFTIHPKRMPRPKSVALVTLVTDHGERRAITIRVEKKRSLFGLFLVGMVLVATAAGAALWASGWLSPQGAKDTPLTIHVDPTAEAIYVDEIQVGSGSKAVVTSGYLLNQPVMVRATHDGFETATATVTVIENQPATVNLHLQLTDPLHTGPAEGLTPVDVDPELFGLAVKPRLRGLGACIAGASPALAGQKLTLNADVYVDSQGKLLYIASSDPNLESTENLECVRRHLRAAQFPLLDGDYAVVKGHELKVTVPSADGPSE